jgi:hypothetical protein
LSSESSLHSIESGSYPRLRFVHLSIGFHLSLRIQVQIII